MTGRYLGELGLSPQATGAAGGAASGAKIGTAIMPGIGTAIGAVVGAVAGGIIGGKDPNKAQKKALSGNLDEYINLYMGKVPGRAFGVQTMEQLIDAAGYRGLWPNVRKWSGDAIHGAIYGCKGCTPPTLVDWVRQQIASGNLNPMLLADPWGALVQKTWGSKWFVPSGNVQRQLIVDLLDALIANQMPNAPLFYGAEPTTPEPTPTAGGGLVALPPGMQYNPAPGAPVPLPAPAPLPIAAATPPPVIASVPPPTVAPPPSTVTAPVAVPVSPATAVTMATPTSAPAQVTGGSAFATPFGYDETQATAAAPAAEASTAGSGSGLLLAGLALGAFVLLGGGGHGSKSR